MSTIFSILLLNMPIFVEKFSVDWYFVQECNIVHIIKIIKYTGFSCFVVEICHFVRPTQTSILADSVGMSLTVLSFSNHFASKFRNSHLSKSYIFTEYLNEFILYHQIKISWICAWLAERAAFSFYNAIALLVKANWEGDIGIGQLWLSFYQRTNISDWFPSHFICIQIFQIYFPSILYL